MTKRERKIPKKKRPKNNQLTVKPNLMQKFYQDWMAKKQ